MAISVICQRKKRRRRGEVWVWMPAFLMVTGNCAVGCGRWTRTIDLMVMSHASYQLLHSAICLSNALDGCKAAIEREP